MVESQLEAPRLRRRQWRYDTAHANPDDWRQSIRGLHRHARCQKTSIGFSPQGSAALRAAKAADEAAREGWRYDRFEDESAKPARAAEQGGRA